MPDELGEHLPQLSPAAAASAEDAIAVLARADERIRGWLHHIHTVRRAFTGIWTGAAPLS